MHKCRKVNWQIIESFPDKDDEIKNDIVDVNVVHIAVSRCCNMTSLINKSANWSIIIKQPEHFSKCHGHLKSMY